MAGQLDTEAMEADQWLQVAVTSDAAHSPQGQTASASHGLGQGVMEADAEGDLCPQTADGLSGSKPGMRNMDLKEDLRKAIDALNPIGSFAACGSPEGVRIPDPGIFVRGAGPIRLPMRDAQARKLKQMTQRTSFGHDDEAVLDTSVELGPHDFDIRNPHWGRLVEQATQWAAQQLGIRTVVSAQLHKMLLHDNGPTLNPHTDTIQRPGTFGTLLIYLPSGHQGGELVIRHEADKKVFKPSANMQFFACWYSDVTCEVLPVTSGYRWVLSYDLVHPPGTEQPSANGLSHPLLPLHRALRGWSDEGEHAGYDHMYYMLGDKHTGPSLSLSSLQRAARVQVLMLDEAAASCGYEIFLAFLKKNVTTERDESYYPSRYYDDGFDESGRFDKVDEEDEGDETDEEDDETKSEHVPEKATFSLSNLVNLRGRQLITEYTFSDEGECVNNILQGHDAFDSVYFEEELEENSYGGNQGATAVYRYYSTPVVIIIPRQHSMKFLKDHMDSTPTGPFLKYFAKKCCKPDTRAAALPIFRDAFHIMLHGGGDDSAMSETSHVALSADVQLFNTFMNTSRMPMTQSALTLLREMLQSGHVKFEQVKQSLSSMYRPGRATLSLDERLKTLQALVPPASDLSQPAEEVRDWTLEMVVNSVKDCSTDSKVGPEGETLVNMIVAHHGFDDLCTNLTPIIEAKATGHGVSFSLAALSAIAKHISGGTVPRKEGIDTFRRLSKLLVEKLDIKTMPVAPPAAEEHPAKSARHNYGLNTHVRASGSVTDGFAVRPEALAGFLDDLVRTESDDIIMQLGFSILGQIQGVTRESLERIWLPFLNLVPGILEAHSIPLSTPRYQCIFGGVLDAYTGKAIGKQPQMFQDSLQRPQVLCQRECAHCELMNDFLSDASRRHIYLSIHSDHLERQFRNILGCSWTHVDGQPPEIRLITKVPPPDPHREQWEQCCRHAQEEIRQIDQEKLLAVLGDVHYRRFTTMNHLRHASPVPAWVPDIPPMRALAPVSGNPSVGNPGHIPRTNTTGRGTPAQRHTAPGRPQPAVPIAGTKRPAPPLDQVVDLTWMD